MSAKSQQCSDVNPFANEWIQAVKYVAGNIQAGDVSVGTASKVLSPYWREAKSLGLTGDERFQYSVSRAINQLAETYGPRVGPYSGRNPNSCKSPSSPKSPRSPSNYQNPNLNTAPTVSNIPNVTNGENEFGDIGRTSAYNGF